MAPDTGQPSHALTEISRYAIGTRQHASTLRHAHEVGVPPGRRKPWTIEYLRVSVDIWLETCPESYVAQIGRAVSTYATLMQSQVLVEGPCEDWDILLQQAEAIVTAVDEHLQDGIAATNKAPPRTGGVPGVIRYDKLAALSDRKGVLRLEAAGAEVAAYCQRHSYGDISAEEIEWLRALGRGQRTIAVASEAGRSEREFYRTLQKLWQKLGVGGRSEAIRLASQMGWLDEDAEP